jgi:hypothetical protein
MRCSLTEIDAIFSLNQSAKRKKKLLSKFLAATLDDMSRLYLLAPRAPQHIPLYPFCGIPILGSLYRPQAFGYIMFFDLIHEKG